jgi:hypothetical protein
VIAAGAILGYVLIKNGKAEAPKYRTEAVAKGDVESVVTTSGTINPIDIVDVGSQVSGKIIKLGRLVGVKAVDRGPPRPEILKSKVEQDDSATKPPGLAGAGKVNLET